MSEPENRRKVEYAWAGWRHTPRRKTRTLFWVVIVILVALTLMQTLLS